ncbi:S9 family peptidase [Catalinimonas niigatensis]|uniref:S9 family peptidase n=1 Tax=Catalinimonas niigatensis TaxID=1397264 RepID=UPI0026666971|nr:S9 family peptidase [Catalinimonas niigatensis]WPP51605.1 S9 family peptidase [Catalinimonas niigatensis]
MSQKLRYLLFFLSFPLLVWSQEKQPLLTSDVLKIKTADQISISPYGNRAVYVVTSIVEDEEQDYKYLRHLWLANLDHDNPSVQQLTYGDQSDGQPSWSPDGSKIAFVRKHEDKSQIWILPLTGGEAYVLTKVKHGASNPQWSPDGTQILFTSNIPMEELSGTPAWDYERPGRTFGDTPNFKNDSSEQMQVSPDGDLESVRAWLAKNASKENPKVINRLDFQGELGLDNQVLFQHLFVINAQPNAAQPGARTESDTAQQITDGFQNFQSPSWSPDGNRIVCSSISYTQMPDREIDSDLWEVVADGSGSHQLLDMPDMRLYSPAYSPDGKMIAFSSSSLTDITYAQTELGIVQADGSAVQILTNNFDRRISDIKWSADNKEIYFTAPNEGYVPLYKISVRNGRTAIVLGEQLGINGYDAHEDVIVYAATEVTQPYELYMADAKGSNAQQLTTLNSDWLADKQMIQPQRYSIENEGHNVEYWVMEPVNRQPNMQYPVVLEMHGGPSAMWGPGEFSMWHEFQLLCSWGYAVVYANPIGSSGYGDAFRRANYQNWGKGPANDVLSALDDAMQKHTWMDNEQQFITGGSYAGYLTAWIVSQTNRFDAAVAQRGVYELEFFFGEGNAWRLAPDHFGGYPWEAEAKASMEANSPQTFVSNIQTPLLIMHADTDLRTGVRQSELLYRSLKVLKRPVEYVRYPGEGHELSRSGNPLRRMDRLNRIVEFFERYAEHSDKPAATLIDAAGQE